MSSIGSPTAPRVPVTTQSPVQQAPEQSPVQCGPEGPGHGPSQLPPWGPHTPPPYVPFPPGGDAGQVPSYLPPSAPPSPPYLPGQEAPVPTDPTIPTDPTTPTDPTDPTTPTDPTDPTTPTDPEDPKDGGSFDIKPWLIGAGVIAGGALAVLAVRDGARNLRALKATANAFETGAMHQGGLQAISDAGLGARFTKGIGLGEKLLVAAPIVNRIGVGGRLTSVARGHLSHAEMMAAATALQRGAGDAVSVSAPLRAEVLDKLEAGRSLPSVLDDLHRSAAGARPYFGNARLAGYWDNASIVESGSRAAGTVNGATTMPRPELGIVDRVIAQTDGPTRAIDRMVTSRGAKLGTRDFAAGIGSLQAANVETLSPALRENAIAMSGVDPSLVELLGLHGAYAQRWAQRLA